MYKDTESPKWDRPYNTVGGELDSRNLGASGALLDLQTGFYNVILRPIKYQLRKCFRREACCWALGETAQGRQNQQGSLQPGNSTSISLTHSSLKNTREWLLMLLNTSGISITYSWFCGICLNLYVDHFQDSLSFCSFLLCTDDFHHHCTNRNFNLLRQNNVNRYPEYKEHKVLQSVSVSVLIKYRIYLQY